MNKPGINCIDDMFKLNYLLKEYFGFIPSNLIIESPDILNEINDLPISNRKLKSHDMHLFDIRIMKQCAEVF